MSLGATRRWADTRELRGYSRRWCASHHGTGSKTVHVGICRRCRALRRGTGPGAPPPLLAELGRPRCVAHGRLSGLRTARPGRADGGQRRTVAALRRTKRPRHGQHGPAALAQGVWFGGLSRVGWIPRGWSHAARSCPTGTALVWQGSSASGTLWRSVTSRCRLRDGERGQGHGPRGASGNSFRPIDHGGQEAW